MCVCVRARLFLSISLRSHLSDRDVLYHQEGVRLSRDKNKIKYKQLLVAAVAANDK